MTINKDINKDIKRQSYQQRHKKQKNILQAIIFILF